MAEPRTQLPSEGVAQQPDSMFRAVSDATSDAIFVKDLTGRYVYVNPACARLFNADIDAIVGSDDDAWFGPIAGAELRAYDASIRERESAANADEVRTLGGRRHVFSTTKAPWRDAAGRVLGIIGIARDITALHDARAQLEAIAASSPGALYSYHRAADRTPSFPYLSPAFAALYGVPPHAFELRPRLAVEMIHPDDLAGVLASIDRSERDLTPWRSDYRVANPLRGEVWIEANALPTRNADGSTLWHGVLIDVSARKAAETALRESEARYRTLVELLPDAVFLVAGETITFCNPQLLRLLGAGADDALAGSSAIGLFAVEERPRFRELLARMSATRATAPPSEWTLVACDGAARRVSMLATHVVEGPEARVLVVLRDVTELHRTASTLRSVLESVNDAIVTIDAGGSVVAANPATARLFGYDVDELLGRNVKMLMPEPHRSAHDGYLARRTSSKGAVFVGGNRVVAGLRKDGTEFPIELSVTSFVLNGARQFTGVIRDMTERRKLEEQFRQAHKMEAFGQLAGGVAHDFNNLLTIILGETDRLGATLDEDGEALATDDAREALRDIHEAGQRAAGLTRQLLAFSRRTVLEPRVVDVNEIVRSTVGMLRRLIGEDVHISCQFAPNLARVNVDPGQLTQVLMNLAVNARDAMPRGGELELETANVVVAGDREPAWQPAGANAGTHVRIAVRDTGTGMTPEVQAQLFQPFFTTKEVGRGTGLGLAVVHGIVTQSGGTIRVESESGRGTTFEILLPAGDPHVRGQSEPAGVPGAANENVLVVEDDEAVRRLAARTLAARGYRVKTAADGEAALALLAAAHEKIDLVITDVVMPRMDGRALGSAIGARFPKLKLLYVSGYTDDVLLRRGLAFEGIEFLSKPYTPASLYQAVRRALDR